MSTCQTWATSSHFRHPWYDVRTMKRKRGDNDTPLVSPPLTKRRRRYSDLEEGFAYLSIAANHLPYKSFASDTISVQEIPAPTIMDAEMSSASSSPSLQPAYIVEEPTIPEVNMKTSSWYEPERDRIVITDLDSFTQSDDEDEQDVSVNAALLEKIRANANVDRTQLPSAPTQPTNQALVLFNPLPWTSVMDGEARRQEREVNVEHVKSYEPLISEDDAMDVEI